MPQPYVQIEAELASGGRAIVLGRHDSLDNNRAVLLMLAVR